MWIDLEDPGISLYVLNTIRSRLKRRGLYPCTGGDDWEIHGPHPPNMKYSVYVGWAKSIANPEQVCCVAIYPKAVYEIGERSQWGTNARPENRIYMC